MTYLTRVPHLPTLFMMLQTQTDGLKMAVLSGVFLQHEDVDF